ncbi:TonB-dependent receptor plug domain-containing protein [Roseateles sp. DB2]|uniref:TonB-dependent receptor plug domain-containing protein n=1 Tax=Roseateles sp. DB2 TaxID=3453717 RepID=UPI003EEE9B7D
MLSHPEPSSSRFALRGLCLSLSLMGCTHLVLAQEAAPAPATTASSPRAATMPAAERKATEKPAAPATETRQTLEKVEISGGPSDDATRRASSAAKIVISREEIEKFGDSSLGEVMKRLPGVTTGGRPGRGGDIRMRGMGGGFTQILVNGERMPPGFSLDQLPPEQVERIEIMRAPTAEYGARAIAGTINVVLREAYQRKVNDVRAGLTVERSHVNPNVSWQRNDKLDNAGSSYNLALNAMQMKHEDDQNGRTVSEDLHGGPARVLSSSGSSSDDRKMLNANGRVQWRLGEGESFALQPFLSVNKGSSSSQQRQSGERSDGRPLPYDSAQTEGRTEFKMLRLNTQLQKKLDPDTRLDLRAGLGRALMDSRTLRQEFLGGVGSRTQDDTVNGHDRNWSLMAKVARQLENDHSLVGGLEAENQTRQQTRLSLQNGLPRPELADFGDNLSASVRRFAAYGQDEWSVGPHWSFYAGLRWEGIETKSDAANYAVSNKSSVWTPLLHAVWKPDEKSRNQVRMSLTRSYRSPQLQDLIARPSINSDYPCPADGACGPNAVQYPDRSGNPDLRPEMATGLEIAFERYLAKGGLLSANVFYRHINDLIRTETRLETVSWASVPRWVARPQNIGKARTFGLELEAKFRLDEFVDDALPLNLRGNLSLFSSSVDGIPGPNNRLDAQPKGTVNIGVDYKLRSLPLTLAAGLNWTPGGTIQQTLIQQSVTPVKRVIDASATWAIDRDTQLRLSASNLAPLDYNTSSIITTADKRITTDSLGRSFTVWQLRWERKL